MISFVVRYRTIKTNVDVCDCFGQYTSLPDHPVQMGKEKRPW